MKANNCKERKPNQKCVHHRNRRERKRSKRPKKKVEFELRHKRRCHRASIEDSLLRFYSMIHLSAYRTCLYALCLVSCLWETKHNFGIGGTVGLGCVARRHTTPPPAGFTPCGVPGDKITHSVCVCRRYYCHRSFWTFSKSSIDAVESAVVLRTTRARAVVGLFPKFQPGRLFQSPKFCSRVETRQTPTAAVCDEDIRCWPVVFENIIGDDKWTRWHEAQFASQPSLNCRPLLSLVDFPKSRETHRFWSSFMVLAFRRIEL